MFAGIKLKKFVLKMVRVIISMISIIKFKDFDFDNISAAKKHFGWSKTFAY